MARQTAKKIERINLQRTCNDAPDWFWEIETDKWKHDSQNHALQEGIVF